MINHKEVKRDFEIAHLESTNQMYKALYEQGNKIFNIDNLLEILESEDVAWYVKKILHPAIRWKLGVNNEFEEVNKALLVIIEKIQKKMITNSEIAFEAVNKIGDCNIILLETLLNEGLKLIYISEGAISNEEKENVICKITSKYIEHLESTENTVLKYNIHKEDK
ncbi:MAG TPA: hypothetical protein DCP90_07905 [Clostridiales bacterium]|nr:MAG: hypothetical protein A2Y22_06100 [Clostridiales bacterium GWD2_32_59]HAN10523.1 hypothetical protein [Clostridiales bacterium]